jgi:hypothetical protein
MTEFPSYPTARREPAVPHQPIVDPAGWEPDDVRDIDRWTYSMDETDISELMDGAAGLRRAEVPIEAVGPETFPLHRLASGLQDVRKELADGRGIVRLRGFPIEELERDAAMMAYLGLGSYVGTLQPQNKYGHLIGHVKRFDDIRSNELDRGYQSDIGSSFHTDSTDYVGLMCFSEAKSGGNSLLASAVTIYNHILAERPDMIEPLMSAYSKTRYGEERPGEVPFYRSHVFAFVDDYFSCTGVSKTFLKSEELPGVAPYSDAQKEAVSVFQRVAAECAIEMPFQRGDIQFANNHLAVHSRRSFENGEGYCRHLWRLWLNDDITPRPLQEERMERRNRGLHLSDVPRNVPLDISEPVI